MKPVFMGVQQPSLGENSRIHIHLAPAFVPWKSSTPVVSEYRMLHSLHTSPEGISAPVCFVASSGAIARQTVMFVRWRGNL